MWTGESKARMGTRVTTQRHKGSTNKGGRKEATETEKKQLKGRV